jgi:hypothetical protein
MHNKASFRMRLMGGCIAVVAMLAPGLAAAQSLPPGWATANIGGASPSGTAVSADGLFKVSAGGTGLTGRADSFRFAYRRLDGDGTIIARLSRIVDYTGRARAGVVIRESLSSDARGAGLLVEANGAGTRLLFRQSIAGKTYQAGGIASTSAPVWLKLTRTGGTITASQSPDGTTWTQVGTATVPMGSTVYAGLAVASLWKGVEGVASFSSVSFPGSGSDPEPVQNVAPTVSLATPAGPFMAPSSMTLNATASDADGTVARVDFYQGTTLLGSDSSSPYAFTWTNVAAGTYALRAVAFDNTGASGQSATVSAVVGSPNQAPTVSLATPAGPFTAPATITLNATATDADGSVARVDFYQGASLLGSDTSSPFAFIWANAPAGTYALRAMAFDNTGASGQSTTVSVTVTAPNQAPTVSLATPGGPFTAPASVALNANAADTDGSVSRVDFYQGNALLGSDTSSPYAFAWANVAAGTYSLRAVAIDNTGATGQSASVNVTVATAANQLPSVSLAVPAGPFTAPASITLNATASDSDGTIARVDFYRNGVVVGSDSSSPYSFAWSNAAAGTYSLRADAIDNTGANGTSATINITVSSPSNNAPAVSLTAPAAGSSVMGPATITVSATASDADGTVARVDFYQGAALIGSDASSPYSVAWSNVPAGSYTFTAVAFDNAGASTTSAGVRATVTSPQAPTVSLTSPVGGTSFVGPASLAMTATASDADGTIARVDFYQGMTLLGTDSSSPYAFAWTNVATGTYVLTAIAVDNSGLTTASSTVQVEVTAANLPQTAIWTPSANDATAVSTYIIEVFPNGVNTTTANPVATHDAGKPAQVNGEYVADIRSVITPLPSGTYVATVTAVGTAGSAQSAPSPAFTK